MLHVAGWWFVTSEKGEVQGWAPGAHLESLVEEESPIVEEGKYQLLH